MRLLRNGAVTLLLAFGALANAEQYAGIGAELGSAEHDLSSESFSILILAGRLGYEFENRFAIEVEATATSGSTKSGEGTCETNLISSIPCSREDEVTRQSLSLLGLYNFNVGDQPMFSSAGIGVINSSYRSTYVTEIFGSVDAVDEESTDMLMSLNVGAIFKEKHRASLVWNAPYGSDKTGEFSYVGLSYNYLIEL